MIYAKKRILALKEDKINNYLNLKEKINMKKIAQLTILLVLSCMVTSIGWGQKKTHQLSDGIYAKFMTNRGEILVKLYADAAPMTVANFVGLAEGDFTFSDSIHFDKPYFDGLKFHRVISKANGDGGDFMIQGGDPQGTGQGGPGYKFYDEFVDSLQFEHPGVLAMANAGPATNGSQFFITIVPTPWLNGKHTIFGNVMQGQNVVDSTLVNDTIKKIEIVRVGKEYSKKRWDATKIFAEKYAVDKKAEDAKVEAMNKIAAMSQDEYKKFAYERALKLYPKAQQSESGLIYEIIQAGDAQKIQAGSKIKVHYTGKFLDGKIFDSSVQRGQPLEFTYKTQGMIPGFDEGLGMLGKGGKAILVIPYYLAYGAMGRPGAIPPYSDLIFEIEVVDAQPAVKNQ